MNVIYTSKIGPTPAAINRAAATLFINPKIMKKLTPFQQKFVIEHEKGHYYLDTSDEVLADQYAFRALAGTEFQSLKQCLGAISEVLPPNNPTRQERYRALYILALEWDAARGNKAAAEELKKIMSENDNFLLIGNAKKFADAEYTRAQADALGDRSDDASSLLKWDMVKNTMNTLLIVALLCAGVYFFMIKK